MQELVKLIEDRLWMAPYLLVNLAGMVMIPLGMPGLWLQFVAALAVTIWTAHLGWFWTFAVLLLAVSGEAIDLMLNRLGIRKTKGSNLASWGAFVFGFIFFFFGAFIPIPIIGSVIMSFIGTFAGALVGEALAQKKISPSLRVATGALIGRVAGAAAKTWIGFLAFCLALGGLLWDVYFHSR